MLALIACFWTALCSGSSSQSIDLEIGKAVTLEDFDGPNVKITVSSVDPYNISFRTADFDRMVVSVVAGYGGSSPTTTQQQTRVTGDSTVLFHRRGISVYYVGSNAMNHVTLAIVKD